MSGLLGVGAEGLLFNFNQIDGGGKLSIRGADKFPSELQLGQIIKGKVMRHISGTHYNVQFYGKELVVDSSVPFNANEIIYGRVVGLGDQVELQRVEVAHANTRTESASSDWSGLAGAGKHARDAISMFTTHNIHLSNSEQQHLAQQLKITNGDKNMLIASLLIKKFNIELSSELMKTVHRLVSADEKYKFNLNDKATILEFTENIGQPSRQDNMQPMAAILKSLLLEIPENKTKDTSEIVSGSGTQQADDEQSPEIGAANSSNDDADKENDSQYDWGRYLLNIQNESSVAHRITTIPMLVAGNLIEIDIAVFSQRESQHSDGIKHRKIVFSLNTEFLGKVDISAYLANEHIRLVVNAETTNATSLLSGYMQDLRTELEDFGWIVDEMKYSTGKDNGGVISSVVEHYISQDSLSRLY